MATVAGIFVPDYAGSQATNLVGTIGQGASTGPIVLAGPYKIYRVQIKGEVVATGVATQNANVDIVRFTLGNTTTSAPTPTLSSPFITSNQEFIFETNVNVSNINLANLIADNGSVTNFIMYYSILPLSKF